MLRDFRSDRRDMQNRMSGLGSRACVRTAFGHVRAWGGSSAGLLAVALCACSIDDRNVGLSDGAAGTGEAQEEKPDVAPPVSFAAGCAQEDRGLGACEGEWRYRRWATCAVSEAGPVTASMCSSAPACSTWRTCEDWSFGVGAPATKVATYQHEVATCRNPGCFSACDEEAASIQAAQDALGEEVPAQYREQVTIAQTEEKVISSRRYSPGFLEDDKFDEIRECTVTFEYPSPASGQAAVCGCAALQCRSLACGVDPNEFTSPVGLAFEAVRAQDPDVADTFAPACSSCDTVALDEAPDRGAF